MIKILKIWNLDPKLWVCLSVDGEDWAKICALIYVCIPVVVIDLVKLNVWNKDTMYANIQFLKYLSNMRSIRSQN